MKKLCVALLLFISVAASSQIRKVPAEVTDAFKAKYPKAEKVEWKDNLTNFEAEFVNGGVETNTKFNKKGEWISTEKTVDFNSLPAAVKDGFQKSKFADWEVKSVKWLDGNDKEARYRILVKKTDVQKKYLFFDTNGKLIRDAITI